MQEYASLTSYPVFRFTIAIGIGIFSIDWLVDVLCGGASEGLGMGSLVSEVASDSPGRCMRMAEGVSEDLGMNLQIGDVYWGVLSLIVLVFCLMCWQFRQISVQKVIRLRRSYRFGVLSFLVMFLFGGIRLLQERERIDFNWSPERKIYVGEVMTPPVSKGKVFQAEFEVEKVYDAPDSSFQTTSVTLSTDSQALSKKFKSFPVHRRILLSWSPDSLQSTLTCGSRVLFLGRIQQPQADVELTGFDYGRYLYRKGMSGATMAFEGDWQLIGENASISLKQYALKCRELLVERYRNWKLGEEELAVVAALTVGDKQVLSDSLKERYSAAGVSHVLALSGLHVGILSAILYFMLVPLKWFKRGEKLRTLLVVLVLWGFAFITGLSPSVVRAVTMCTLYFVASCMMEGRFPGMYTLVLAAFLMLIYQPLYLFDLSCQLSFLAVASILCFFPVVSNLWQVRNSFFSWVWKGMAVSVSAQLGTLPLILYYFGTFPTYFLVANLVVGVLAVCVLCGTLVALLVSEVPWLGMVSIAFVDRVTWAMNASMLWVQQLSGAQLQSLSISVWQSCCGFVFLISLYLFVRRRRVIPLIGMLASFNASLVDWNIQGIQSFDASSPSSVYLYRSQLYLKQQQQLLELTSANQLYVIDTLRIGILKDDRWRWKEASPLIEVDYLYIGRGFKGSLEDLKHVFRFNQLVLDASLSSYYLNKLTEACQQQQITYAWSTPQRAYAIPLSSLTE